jgi:type IV secretion system protein TrbL
VVNRFLEVFSRYIDSGFGLLGGEVAFLATTLVAIDITLAALFWAWSPGEEILARLVKKTLFVGFFAFLIGNFQALANIVFASFSGLGLKATGGAMSAADFLQPGKLAQAGIDAGRPLLENAGELARFPGFFDNFVQIAVLLVAWLVVMVAFFVLAVQLFVTIIEFKLTTLAGFVLVPFGLFGRTAFLAEKVLGNVMASGIKVLVLAIVVGIGSTLFDEFVRDYAGAQPTLEEVLAIVLGAVTLLGLGIFGPGIATGLVSGGPQLGAGAAVGTGLAIGGMAMVGAAGVGALAGAGGALAGAGAGSRLAPAGSGDSGLTPGGPSGGAPPRSPTGGGAGVSAPGPAAGPRPQPDAPGSSSGANAGFGATPSPTKTDEAGGPPAWAKDLERRQALTHGAAVTAHAIGGGDHGGGSTTVSLTEDR